MNVFNIASTQGPRGPEDSGSSRKPSSSSRGSATHQAGSAEDTFSSSGKAEQVEGLVEALKEQDAARSDLVDKFKALMSVGGLDTPAAAERAAAAILGTASE